ncbi:MAG TPA: FAD-dependent monooxygenase [Bryobacteraceae bacterium]|nr:FAD-dependent monooxygenase [Bryobacteraceae bacterium]
MRGFDVVVLGGGPAGCVTAMLLARQGIWVAILDRPPRRPFSIGETLPPQATRLLAELDLTDRFRRIDPLPSSGIISIWGSETPQVNDFIFSVHGNGWHIERSAFNRMLVDAAADAGAAFFTDVRIDNCAQNAAGWSIGVSTPVRPDTLHSRFIVDARGRAAGGTFGFPGRVVLDSLIAVAGVTTPQRGAVPSDFTLIEAVEPGWFYSALLPCGKYIVTLMTDADMYSSRRAQSQDYLKIQLSQAPRTRERIEIAPERAVLFSAVASLREPARHSNWLAVGDAAMSYDPLSGQGLWGAMRMAQRAASAIVTALEGSHDHASLTAYERENRERFANYVHAHTGYYRSERRWPESAFWKRRLEAPVVSLPSLLQRSSRA